MSSRQMEEMDEERHEAAFEKALARELGLTLNELRSLEYEVETNDTNDGMAVGYNVTFDVENSDPDVLPKIKGLVNGYWIRIGLLGIE